MRRFNVEHSWYDRTIAAPESRATCQRETDLSLPSLSQQPDQEFSIGLEDRGAGITSEVAALVIGSEQKRTGEHSQARGE